MTKQELRDYKREWMRRWVAKNKKQWKAHRREYRKKHRQERARYNLAWYRNNKERARQIGRRSADKRKSKRLGRTPQVRAHNAVNYALKTGRLIRASSCANCGGRGERKLHAHHYKGYAQKNRLNVTWLCELCHKKAHAVIENQLS